MPYRYSLERRISEAGGPSLCWLMLNPSTADATRDDPTIRKVIGFTRRAGYARAVVVNLFAWRATDPRDLRERLALRFEGAEGRHNRAAIEDAAAGASAVVCAWGATPWAASQATRVLGWLAERARSGSASRAPLLCLGLTRLGAPRHPLMLAYHAHPLVPFEPVAAWTSRAAAVG